MNKNQRIVIGAGIVLILLCGLFPPFRAQTKERAPSRIAVDRTENIGFYFVFSPPNSKVASNTMWGNSSRYRNTSVEVDLTILLIQLLTVTLATAGLTVLFRDKRIDGF